MNHPDVSGTRVQNSRRIVSRREFFFLYTNKDRACDPYSGRTCGPAISLLVNATNVLTDGEKTSRL